MVDTTVALPSQTRHGERRNLVRHFIEMILAMAVGMFVLGMVVQFVCTLLGHDGFFLHHVGLRAPLMATNMAIGMAAWMRYRHHSWAAIGEMAGAMYVPLVVLIGPFWAGALSGGALLLWMHVLMLPCMVLAMEHRRPEYTVSHAHHAHVSRSMSAAASTRSAAGHASSTSNDNGGGSRPALG